MVERGVPTGKGGKEIAQGQSLGLAVGSRKGGGVLELSTIESQGILMQHTIRLLRNRHFSPHLLESDFFCFSRLGVKQVLLPGREFSPSTFAHGTLAERWGDGRLLLTVNSDG